MGVPHPIPYQGSKRNLAKYILQYFPQDTWRLVEPFAGSSAVSLAALHYKKVEFVLIGDIDDALVKLLQEIAVSPLEIAGAYAAIWNRQFGQERAFYDLIRKEFNSNRQPDHFLFLLARCVKAAVRYNSNGEFNQSPDNRRKGTHPENMKRNILGASRLLKDKAVIRHCDYRELLIAATPQDIVYLDPPYQGVCKNRDPRYREKVSYDNFVNQLTDLNQRDISFIVSYDGRTEEKIHGNYLPSFLDLTRIELDAGRSSQATLLGRQATTFEALYLSPALMKRRSHFSNNYYEPIQLPLLGAS